MILVLLFRYVFGGAIDTGDVSYVDFLIPGHHRDDRRSSAR